MGKLIYAANVSLDGFLEDDDGRFDWSVPDEPVHAFWLPTSSGRFYPDFVCELTDGRFFVAEYKGAHLRADRREIEKGQVGQVWAERSGGGARCSPCCSSLNAA